MAEREKLGSPGYIGKLQVKNRIIMEAMGNGLSLPNGNASPQDIAFYEARAKGGVGLIVSEAISVDSVTGRANPNNMCVDTDDCIAPLQKMMDVLHSYDCKFFVELYHPGRQGANELNGGRPMFAPSAIECGLVHAEVVEMTQDDIDYITEKFVQGAVRSQKGRADGVMIHAAHGYLVNEFLSPYTNKRTDAYGGSVENRAKFVTDIIDGIRNACGSDFPIGVRISACEYLDYEGLHREDGITLELSKQYVPILEEHGADLIDVSAGIYETMNTAWEPVGFEQGWKSELAMEIRKVTSLPVVCTSVIRDPAYAESLLEQGVCDFIGSARSHLADPEWSNKALRGDDGNIRKCISCLNCMKSLMSGPVKCAVNAQGCHELERGEIRKDGNGRPVVVIGGGPAGMEAARVLALREYDVTLYEKEPVLGGTFLLASMPPHKVKLRAFIDYLERQIRNLGVHIFTGKVPTQEEIECLHPAATFISCGADPVIPNSIPGIHGEHVYSIYDVLRRGVNLHGRKVVLIGGGMTGLEVAEYLDSNGSSVEVYEMMDGFAREEHFQNVIDVEKRLGNVPQYSGHKLLEIGEKVCRFEVVHTGEQKNVPYDAVVLSMGMKPSRCPETEYAGLPNVHVIGANHKFGSVAICVEDAYLAATGDIES